VLSKLLTQLGSGIVNMQAPTLTTCVGNIRLNATLPRALGVPNGSVPKTFLCFFLFLSFLSPACIPSSIELQSIPLIASLSTAAIDAALPHMQPAIAEKRKSVTPHAIQCNFMQKSPNAEAPALRIDKRELLSL
jgi:hypothetical protein